MYPHRFISPTMLATLLLTLTGCIGSTPPSHFYLLEPIQGIEIPDLSTQPKMFVALAPIRIPKYATRSQLITKTSPNKYQINELNRWAESLDDNITRVLIQNLSSLVPAEILQARSSNLAKQAPYRLYVNILDYYFDAEGKAILTANWQVTKRDDSFINQQMTYHASAANTDYEIMVKTLNDCLNSMSRDIALQLRRLYHEDSDVLHRQRLELDGSK